MMQYVYVQFSPGFPWQKQHSSKRRLIHQQIGLKLKEETSNSKVLHFEHSFVCCWYLDTV